MNESLDQRDPIEALAEEFMERKRRGEQPTLEEYVAGHPNLENEIRELFPALLMMENLGVASSATTGSIAGSRALARGVQVKKLGDYRILREIGRGGMGVVFEAEQESLGRRVALKVLSSSAMVDDKQIRRFEREAKSAARLHHTNIVPVFGVGHQDGHHYYVMQFIQGHSLDVVLEELRRLKKASSVSTALANPMRTGRTGQGNGVSQRFQTTLPDEPALTAAGVANSLLTGLFVANQPPDPDVTRPEGERSVTQAQESADPPGELLASPSQLPQGNLPLGGFSVDGSSPGLSTSSLSLSSSGERSHLSDQDRHFYQGVARVGLQVAEALDYANNQGIVHRDIKPSNLLLDTKGNVWVTDFGLAKASDAEDLTHTGDILGTIRYMAPERFQGLCDARSDIYSLGLTLYELASMQPAYDGSERHKLMDRVLHEEPVRLKKLAPTVPRDLETIIQKSIARDPAQRYASAASLAEDLQRFIDDKPIRARHATTTEKVVRWCRRNPALSSLSAGLLLLLIGTAVASTLAAARFSAMAEKERQIRTEAEAAFSREVQQRRKTDEALRATEAAQRNEAAARHRAEAAQLNESEARHRAEANQQEAVRQQKMAEENFNLARRAVDDYLTRVSENRLLRVPGLQPLRKELLESALTYYRGFLSQRKDDLTLQKDMALAHARLAGITAEIGSKDEAMTILDQALAIRKKLQAAEPKNPALKLDLVDHYLSAAPLQLQLAKPDGARKSCQQAYDILLSISPQNPQLFAMINTAGGTALSVQVHKSDSVEILQRFAQVLKESGAAAAADGVPHEAITDYAQAIYVLQHLVANHGDHPRIAAFRQELANQWNLLGSTEAALGMPDEALAAYQEALKVLEELGKGSPGHSDITDFQRELAATHQNIGDIEAETQKLKEALISYQEALSIRRKLARENPAVTDDQVDLARVLCVLGGLQDRSGDADGAIQSLRQAIDRQSLLVEMAPGAKPHVRDLSRQYSELARLQRKSKLPSEAIASYRQARDLLEKLPPSGGEDWQSLASWRAAAASLIGAGKTELGADLQTQKTQEEDLAVGALRQAAAAGFNNLDQIQKNDDYAPLRHRPEFKTLLDELEKKRKVLVWNQDLEAAKAQAAKERKDLFLYFGGSDWCPYDAAMRKGFLSKDAFRDYANEHFVIVEFDDPQRKAKPANHSTRVKFEEPWKITGCPTTVLADARGRRYAQIAGAFTGSMDEYLKSLDRLRKVRTTRDELLLKAVHSQGTDRARLLGQALNTLPDEVLTSYAEEYRELLRLDPADQAGIRTKYQSQQAEMLLAEAQRLAGKKDWRGVLQTLNDDFLALQPTGDVAANGSFLRGLAHADLNQLEQAVGDYAQMLSSPKVHPVFHYQNAMLLLATGRYEEYRAACRRLIRRYDQNSNVNLVMPVLQSSRLADGAADDYGPLIARAAELSVSNKDKFPFVRTLGHLLYRAGRYGEAIERLEEAFKLGKETHPFLVPDGYFLAMAHHRLGHAEEARARLEKAERFTEKLYADPKVNEIFKAIKSENNWQNRLVSELIRAEANALIRGKADPKNPAAELALARAFARLGQWDEAVTAYGPAIDRDPTNAHLLIERAQCQIRLGQAEPARTNLARVTDLAPGDLRLVRERARIYADWRRWSEAADDYAKALAGVPQGPAESVTRRHIYEELLRWEPVFARVVELRPDDHDAWFSRGNIRARAGDWKRAAADYDKAIALKPDKHVLWYQQAPLLIEAGDEAGYHRLCRQVLERFGTSRDPVIAERTAKVCLLLPGRSEHLPAAASLAETALAEGADNENKPYFELIKGLVEYREGNHSAASARLDKLVGNGNPDWDLAPPAYLILAMAQHRLGEKTKSSESLGRAVQIMNEQVPNLTAAGDSWHGWVMNQLLRSEAESLILYDPIFPADPFAN